MAHPLRYGSHDENAAAGKQGQRKSPAQHKNFAVVAGVSQMRLRGRRSQWGADVGRKWREWFVQRTAIRDHDATPSAVPAGCIPSGRAVLKVNAHGARRPCDISFPTGESMKSAIRQFLREEDGVSAIEYGLLAGLISVAIITTVGLIGGNLNDVFTTIQKKLAAIPKT